MRDVEIISYWSEVTAGFAFVVALLMSGMFFAVMAARLMAAIADWMLAGL